MATGHRTRGCDSMKSCQIRSRVAIEAATCSRARVSRWGCGSSSARRRARCSRRRALSLEVPGRFSFHPGRTSFQARADAATSGGPQRSTGSPAFARIDAALSTWSCTLSCNRPPPGRCSRPHQRLGTSEVGYRMKLHAGPRDSDKVNKRSSTFRKEVDAGLWRTSYFTPLGQPSQR